MESKTQKLPCGTIATEELRAVVVEIAYERGLKPKQLRQLVCRILRVEPHAYNWSDFPNVDDEVRDRLRDCEWYYVYDVIEEIYVTLSSGAVLARGHRGSQEEAEEFAKEINRYFRVRGIGWQLIEGRIEVRRSESFEDSVKGARVALEQIGRPTAANELHEALRDLSRQAAVKLQKILALLPTLARGSWRHRGWRMRKRRRRQTR